MTLPIGTLVRSTRNNQRGIIVGYGSLSWPHSKNMNGDGGVIQPVYLVQVHEESNAQQNACTVMRADMVEDRCCDGNDPACTTHGVAASNARENDFYRRNPR